MEIHYKIVGILLIALSFVHLVFPKYFNWTEELRDLSLANRQIMYIHTFFIALVVFLIGLLCLTSAKELISNSFGKKVAFGIGIFWLIRLFVQFFGYSPRLWKGKAFETTIHIVFSIFWTYLSVLFLASYWI